MERMYRRMEGVCLCFRVEVAVGGGLELDQVMDGLCI